jgi:hypothetical protein
MRALRTCKAWRCDLRLGTDYSGCSSIKWFSKTHDHAVYPEVPLSVFVSCLLSSKQTPPGAVDETARASCIVRIVKRLQYCPRTLGETVQTLLGRNSSHQTVGVRRYTRARRVRWNGLNYCTVEQQGCVVARRVPQIQMHASITASTSFKRGRRPSGPFDLENTGRRCLFLMRRTGSIELISR